jgi:uncharacterized hydrophobic protein (TIGR00271 family)
MPTLHVDEVARMRDSVLFDGDDAAKRVSRFWILLVLASVIASAGIVADSTATVIGAMIVAPLMLPIQGTMLSVVLADRKNLLRSLGLMVGGALAAILIGWLIGLLVVNDVVAANNSQVAGRVQPTLIDLLAALATGLVGSIALIRRDISDTLPGVAIAISLVPPLSVVGLTFEAGAYEQSLGALLLFLTNVAAILGTGTVLMVLYRVHRISPPSVGEGERAVNRRNAFLVIAAMVVIVGVPLTVSTVSISRDTSREATVHDAAQQWARTVDWELTNVTTREGRVIATFGGPLPVPDVDGLRVALAAGGVDPSVVSAEFIPREVVDLGDPSG